LTNLPKGQSKPTRENGWSRPFDDPVDLPRGRQLATLEDAGNYITKLPKAEHSIPEWQQAMEALMLVAKRGGPTMLARIGVMRALRRPGVQRRFGASGSASGINSSKRSAAIAGRFVAKLLRLHSVVPEHLLATLAQLRAIFLQTLPNRVVVAHLFTTRTLCISRACLLFLRGAHMSLSQ
jgi:hypothetical protein